MSHLTLYDISLRTRKSAGKGGRTPYRPLIVRRDADRRIFDGDQHLVDTRGMWVGDLYPFYHLERIAELCYLKGTHASSLWNGCHLGSN